MIGEVTLIRQDKTTAVAPVVLENGAWPQVVRDVRRIDGDPLGLRLVTYKLAGWSESEGRAFYLEVAPAIGPTFAEHG